MNTPERMKAATTITERATIAAAHEMRQFVTSAKRHYRRAADAARRAERHAKALCSARARAAAQSAEAAAQDISLMVAHEHSAAIAVAMGTAYSVARVNGAPHFTQDELLQIAREVTAPIVALRDKARKAQARAEAAERDAYHRIGYARCIFEMDILGSLEIKLADPDLAKGQQFVAYIQLSQEITATLEYSDLTKAEIAELDKGYIVAGALHQDVIAAHSAVIFGD